MLTEMRSIQLVSTRATTYDQPDTQYIYVHPGILSSSPSLSSFKIYSLLRTKHHRSKFHQETILLLPIQPNYILQYCCTFHSHSLP